VPELPEAETIVRGLRPAIVGERVRRIDVPRPDVLREPKARFARKLRGRTLTGVERRGKNVLITLDDGSLVAVNLGMTGRLLPYPAPPRGRARPGHPAVRFGFAGGGVLVFDDTRRFGTVECLDADAWAVRSARMGPEPLEPSLRPQRFHELLRTSRSPIRSWLLDQRRIAGVGNIYANEALHLAGVHPLTPARDLTAPEAARLLETIREVLRAAIGAGGTTIRDYRNADGAEGQYARQLHVYGRDGQPCPTCASTVERIVLSNRSAFFCPRCQSQPTP
jgi:formamidopyrimidine-DNA glycosylase